MRLAALAAAAASAAAATPKRPHIMFVVADDLGYNDVSFHGSKQVPTPQLDSLAADGVTLLGYYVQPVCSPTRSCFMTGRHVIHTGIYDPDCGTQTTFAVRPEFTMLPAVLRNNSYETHAVGKWHLGSYTPGLVPTGRGFETFYGYYGGAEDYFTHMDSTWRDFHDDVGSDLRPDIPDDGVYSTFLYARRAVKVISEFAKSKEDKSLFMYLAWQSIHSPDQVPEYYSGKFNESIPDTKDGVGQHRRIVAGMIAALDEGVGNVTAALKQEGMWSDTLMIFTTDNGGPAQGFNNNMASNWPLRGMKRTLWEGGVRAVGFVVGAGIRKSGYVNHEMYHAVDWMPSLIAMVINGADADPSSPDWRDWREALPAGEPAFELGDGIDVWGSMSMGTPSPRTEIIHEAHNTTGSGKDDGNGQAIRVGDYKLILEKGPAWHGPPNDLWYESGSNPSEYNHIIQCGPVPNSTAEDYCHPKKLPCLFNIKEDPCEYHDLSKQMPEKVAELKERLAAYQRTAVPVDFHKLPGCGKKMDPARYNNTCMPYCPAQ